PVYLGPDCRSHLDSGPLLAAFNGGARDIIHAFHRGRTFLMKRIATILLLGAAGLVSAPGVYAAPCPFTTPVFHGLDSYFVCDNSKGPVESSSWMYSNPAINSGAEIV